MNFDISGAKIFFRIPTHLPLIGDIVVSETVVVSWLVMLIITGLCIFLTRDLKVEHIGRRSQSSLWRVRKIWCGTTRAETSSTI